jgi:FKBP-type peptidyl-prolyl cis-trans isomerase (trigger factor)
MKSEVKKLDACIREIDIEVESDTVTSKLDEIYKEISKTAKIPGFRPGAAPRELLEKHHSKLAQEELLKTLVNEAYHKSLEEHKIIAYGHADIADVSLKDNILKFKAKVEVRPDIDLKDYKSIKINRLRPEVKEELVEQQISKIAKEREHEADLTDNFARSLGYATLEELKDSVRKQLFLQAQEESYNNCLHQLVEELLKNNPLSVPKGLVKHQLDRRIEELKYRMKVYNQDDGKIEEEIKKIQNQLEQEAEKDVKIILLLEEIARKENIKPKDQSKITQRAIEFLLEHAQWE